MRWIVLVPTVLTTWHQCSIFILSTPQGSQDCVRSSCQETGGEWRHAHRHQGGHWSSIRARVRRTRQAHDQLQEAHRHESRERHHVVGIPVSLAHDYPTHQALSPMPDVPQLRRTSRSFSAIANTNTFENLQGARFSAHARVASHSQPDA